MIILKLKKIFILLFLFIVLFYMLSIFAFADTTGVSIFSGLGDIARFLKRIIVPEFNYFHNKLGEISQHANERLAGVFALYQMLDNFFNELKNAPATKLIFYIPDNFLFRGYKGISINFFESAEPYIRVFRDVVNSTLTIFTSIACYHKLRMLFQQGDNI